MRATQGVSTKFPTGIPEEAPGSFQYTGSFQYSTVRYGTVPRRRAEIEKNILKLGVFKYFARPGRANSIHYLDSSSKLPSQLN